MKKITILWPPGTRGITCYQVRTDLRSLQKDLKEVGDPWVRLLIKKWIRERKRNNKKRNERRKLIPALSPRR